MMNLQSQLIEIGSYIVMKKNIIITKLLRYSTHTTKNKGQWTANKNEHMKKQILG